MKRIWAWMVYPCVWISRIARSRGYGVQSPSDYSMLRTVIREHGDYYSYKHLCKGQSSHRCRLGKFYFRLANWLQPSEIVTDNFQSFFQAGCKKAVVCDVPSGKISLMRIVVSGDYRNKMKDVYKQVQEDSVLIVEDIWADSRFWKEVVESPLTGVCFDLYFCGVVFFDKKRYKKLYKVNF
ncbi:MAG: hypothetical protein K5764_02235 [Prevotella sp.]|nr:hypothetical protein [Prevotella sp.]